MSSKRNLRILRGRWWQRYPSYRCSKQRR